MSKEKYTIDFDGGSTIINDENGDVFIVLISKDGTLIEYARAELVCRLLNEQDKPRIDNYIKEQIIVNLHSTRDQYEEEKDLLDKGDEDILWNERKIIEFNNAIKAIESLPTEE